MKLSIITQPPVVHLTMPPAAFPAPDPVTALLAVPVNVGAACLESHQVAVMPCGDAAAALRALECGSHTAAFDGEALLSDVKLSAADNSIIHAVRRGHGSGCTQNAVPRLRHW